MSKTPGENALVDFAEDLGKLLGSASAKAESWLDQRKQVAAQLEHIRDTATRLLVQIGAEASSSARAAVSRGAKQRRKLSAATRQKMREAWARRKALGPMKAKKAKAGKRAKRTMSAEARKRISEAQKARWAKKKS